MSVNFPCPLLVPQHYLPGMTGPVRAKPGCCCHRRWDRTSKLHASWAEPETIYTEPYPKAPRRNKVWLLLVLYTPNFFLHFVYLLFNFKFWEHHIQVVHLYLSFLAPLQLLLDSPLISWAPFLQLLLCVCLSLTHTLLSTFISAHMYLCPGLITCDWTVDLGASLRRKLIFLSATNHW